MKDVPVGAAMKVPVISHRRMISSAAIEDVVNQIVNQYQPLRVILFGSYAAGNPGPESDVDLLVVMDTQRSEAEQANEICQNIEYLFGLDLIVIAPQKLIQRLEWGDSFLKEVSRTGKVVYESSDA